MSGLPEKLTSHKGVSLFQSTVRDKEKMFLKIKTGGDRTGLTDTKLIFFVL
jgi:hypothetical protein